MKTGIAFGDHIRTEKVPRRRTPMSNSVMRGYVMVLFLAFLFIPLFSKLFSLQVMQGTYFRGLSDSNRIRTETIHAPRGVIFDRNGMPLVYNIPGFREVQGDKIKLLTRDQALPLIAKGDTRIAVDSLREYPLKDATSHVLGYIGQITKDQLQDPTYADYQTDDLIGKSGIEETYEGLLKGKDGKQLIEVDAMGKPMRPLGQTDPIPGQDITLTLDAKLQQATFNAMAGNPKGAAIVSTPTGEILAMVSKPSFDPNLFTMNGDYKAASDSAYPTVASVLLDGNNQPLLNRAISGVYPPGSTFKIIAAATGLNTHVIDDSWTIQDTGVLKIGTFSFANWFYTDYGKTEQGPIDVSRALTRSNDIFFYKLAEKIGVDKLSNGVKQFGLGRELGIDLVGEAKGTVPTEEWKKQRIGEQWYLGDTFNYGIGQGYLLTTPLQVNTWTQVIANGGTLYKPHVLKDTKPVVEAKNLLEDNTLSLIRKGMIGACDPGGVAWPIFNFKVKNPNLAIDGKNILATPEASTSASTDTKAYRHVVVACKTGTAEFGGADTKPHAWITLFAPAYDPQVVITVLKESSGEGSNEAGPIAEKILEAYFGNQK